MLLAQFDYEIIELFVVDVVGQRFVNKHVLLQNLQFGYKVNVFLEGFGYFNHPFFLFFFAGQMDTNLSLARGVDEAHERDTLWIVRFMLSVMTAV